MSRHWRQGLVIAVRVVLSFGVAAALWWLFPHAVAGVGRPGATRVPWSTVAGRGSSRRDTTPTRSEERFFDALWRGS